jgi:hypothetical protein
MDDTKLHEIQEQVKKNSVFLKETTLPIKQQHSDNIEKFIKKFIAFPGGTSIVSAFFTSSEIIVNKNLAIAGSFLIFSSLFVSLYLYLKSITNDQKFYEDILKTELPMVKLSRAFTKFSRNTRSTNHENELLNTYQELQNSYNQNSEEDLDGAQKIRIEKMQNLFKWLWVSFALILTGFILFFLSALPKNFFYELQNKNHVLEGNGIYFFYQIP